MKIKYGFLLCTIFLFPIHLLNAKHVIGASDVLPICKPIFTIGELNKSPEELTGVDFWKVQKLEIDADGIVDTTKFPRRLINPKGNYSDSSTAVKELSINFKILDEESGLFLRIARAGDSDTLVIIDNINEYRVTPEMLGSDEGVFGAYDLHLGTLNKGNHNILLKMPDDGLGSNGRYSWDALILCKE